MTKPDDDLAEQLAAAGRALARHGLVSAFGHVSARASGHTLLITAPVPLATMRPHAVQPLDLDAADLAPGIPREAWIHRAVAVARPNVGAICRAQPPTATALASAGVPIRPLHGQGSFLGPEVPVHPNPRLVRDEDSAKALAGTLGTASAVIMRGNGAVTTGATIGEAVARMWVLEASAVMNATASGCGTPVPLSEDEQQSWRDVAPELLHRIWLHLSREEES
ncbi:class II aldolase/adducin family protein [Micromonospora globispora]|uniref:class II aldolase/adducin family protein n=1 Tax=Micromonospora globispora TaxID=1450148 RepID=UPI001A9C70AD|nr:class II aldolase/adducin family protein [Micromonospora globispora]